MKKILIVIALLPVMIMAAQAQTRLTLHEEFTGENCGPCASINPPFWALCNSNASKLIHITYLVDIPSAGPFYYETQPMFDARSSYYSVPFAPFGTYDGHVPNQTAAYPGEPNYFTQADIDDEAAIPSPFNISSFHYYNAAHDSVFGIVHVHAVKDTVATQLKLRAAFTKTMHFNLSPGSNGEKNYEHVVRAMFPNVNGQSIADTWADSTEMTYYYKGKIKGLEPNGSLVFTCADSNLIVWIQNDSDKAVLQASRSKEIASVGVADVTEEIGETLYPNPALGSATVAFSLATAAAVEVSVIDAAGRISMVAHGPLAAGLHEYRINTGEMPSGVYSVVVRTEHRSYARQLTVLK